MSFAVHIDPRTGVAFATCSGVIQAGECKEGARTLWENREWSGESVVWDLRQATLDVATPDVREIARWILASQPKVPPAKVAFVTGREVDYGLARMFEAYRSQAPTQVQVFRDYQEAVRWVQPDTAAASSA